MAQPQSHESKGMPAPQQADAVSEAFGLLKAPKLVSQISQSSNKTLRLNALRVLCEELRNPLDAGGVARAGVTEVLTGLLKDDDTKTREAASKALAALAVDPNGRISLTDTESSPLILPSLSDPSPLVRSNLYDCCLNYTAIRTGVDSLVAAGFVPVLVSKATTESDDVRHLPLQLLYNCIKSEVGLRSALDSNAVEACINNLKHKDSLVKKDAAGTLGFLCFADSAKITAIQNNAVESLSELLLDPFWKVRANAAQALMSIIQTDSGKKAIVSCSAITPLIKLLKDPEDLVKINVLKTIAAVAVHPEARKEMRESSECLPVIHGIIDGGDEFLSKHASIAREAVLWQP